MAHDIWSLHHAISAIYPKPYSFNPDNNLEKQKKAIREKYIELLKMPEKNFKAVPTIEWQKNEDERFDEIRFTVETEPDFSVPCHMLIPKGRKKGEKLPAVICIQGHSTGMHISMGRIIYERDAVSVSTNDRDYALQAVKRGYIAVCMEQRGLGELKCALTENCHHYTMMCLMTGRTPQGERIHDVMCLVDALECFDAVDTERIGIVGGSGGGTTAYHATALEPRIKVCMPSHSFNTYEESILSIHHCDCNYLPDISKYMEMADLSMLIAPRPLIIVNGDKDPIFPIESAKKGFEIVKKIYTAAGASENCHHVVGDGGHRFFANLSWPFFEKHI